MPNSIANHHAHDTALPLLAREYLITLHSTCTNANQTELNAVMVYLNELITLDERRNVISEPELN